MSVSGYSVSHDFEVQEYNQRRAAWKAAEKKRKQEDRLLQEQAKANNKLASLKHAEDLGLGVGLSWHTNSKSGWSLKWKKGSRKQQSDEGVVEGKLDRGYESDELTLTEALSAQK